MRTIALNIKYLIGVNNLTQKDFGELFGLASGAINTYVKEKAIPKLETMQQICKHFNITLDDFVNTDLSQQKIVPGDYYTDPAIAAMSQEPDATGYFNLVQELRARIEDKDKIIKMLEAEITRLKRGNQKGLAG